MVQFESTIYAGIIIFIIFQSCINQTGVTYYVDGVLGNDANSGTAQAKAWKTLEAFNALELLPGDKVLLNAGCEGVGPVIAGEGKIENTIRLKNPDFRNVRCMLRFEGNQTNGPRKNSFCLIAGAKTGSKKSIQIFN